MAKYGPLFTHWSRDWDDIDIVDVVKKCAQAGADCMEMHNWVIQDWPDHKLQDFRRLYEDLGVDVAYWCGFTPETNIFSADPAIREAATAKIIRDIRFVEKMGGRILDGTYVQPWNMGLEGRDRREALDTSVACFKEMAKVAEECGVMLSMEILNRFEGVLINTMAEAVEVLDRVESPNVQITADSFHMNIEEDGIASALRLGGNRVGHIHLGEANRRLPGNGSQINWNELFGTLRELNYDGMFIFEGFVLHGGSISEAVRVWRDLSDNATAEKLTEDLSRSISFVKNKFEGAVPGGLAHIGVFVSDLDVSKKFYSDLLDFEVLWEGSIPDAKGEIKIALIRNGDLTIELVRLPDHTPRPDGPVDHIAIRTGDVLKARERIIKAGYTPEGDDISRNDTIFGTGGRWFFFRGPDGEHIELADTVSD